MDFLRQICPYMVAVKLEGATLLLVCYITICGNTLPPQPVGLVSMKLLPVALSIVEDDSSQEKTDTRECKENVRERGSRRIV
jgi:hypothetical protein